MVKKSIPQTNQHLVAENEELRSRLVEAEETLYAILNGEVDAIVVSGKESQQIYSISSAETPYRTFIEQMNEGALTLSKDGVIIYCNLRFAEFVNEPIEQVIGSQLIHFIASGDKSKFNSRFPHQSSKKNDVLVVSLINSMYLKLTFRHLPSYLNGESYIIIATDITEIKKKENELRESHRLLKQNLDQIKDLRIDLINAKIDSEVAIRNLMNSNKKLIKLISKQKLVEAEMKQELKVERKKVPTREK
jgi:two-component system CheB/CheR fusion protein